MTSWRVGVDPRILEDFDVLCGVVHDVAMKNIANYGSTIPFGVNIEHDASVRLAAAEPPAGSRQLAQDALELLLEGAIANRASFRAAAIACDVTLESGTDAVRIQLEHSLGGPVLQFFLEYAVTPVTQAVVEHPMQVAVLDERRIWA